MHTVTDRVRWSGRAFNIGSLLQRYENRLPVVVKTVSGFYGANEAEILSAGEVFRIDSLVVERRVFAKDIRGRIFSLPSNLPVKFEALGKHGKRSKIRGLEEIVREHELPTRVAFAEPWSFSVGEMRYDSGKLGSMTLCKIYLEKFLRINTISKGIIDKTVMLLPCYVHIQLQVAEGFIDDDFGNDWKALMQMYDRTVRSLNISDVTGLDDVLVYDPSDGEIVNPTAAVVDEETNRHALRTTSMLINVFRSETKKAKSPSTSSPDGPGPIKVNESRIVKSRSQTEYYRPDSASWTAMRPMNGRRKSPRQIHPVTTRSPQTTEEFESSLDQPQTTMHEEQPEQSRRIVRGLSKNNELQGRSFGGVGLGVGVETMEQERLVFGGAPKKKTATMEIRSYNIDRKNSAREAVDVTPSMPSPGNNSSPARSRFEEPPVSEKVSTGKVMQIRSSPKPNVRGNKMDTNHPRNRGYHSDDQQGQQKYDEDYQDEWQTKSNKRSFNKRRENLESNSTTKNDEVLSQTSDNTTTTLERTFSHGGGGPPTKSPLAHQHKKSSLKADRRRSSRPSRHVSYSDTDTVFPFDTTYDADESEVDGTFYRDAGAIFLEKMRNRATVSQIRNPLRQPTPRPRTRSLVVNVDSSPPTLVQRTSEFQPTVMTTYGQNNKYSVTSPTRLRRKANSFGVIPETSEEQATQFSAGNGLNHVATGWNQDYRATNNVASATWNTNDEKMSNNVASWNRNDRVINNNRGTVIELGNVVPPSQLHDDRDSNNLQESMLHWGRLPTPLSSGNNPYPTSFLDGGRSPADDQATTNRNWRSVTSPNQTLNENQNHVRTSSVKSMQPKQTMLSLGGNAFLAEGGTSTGKSWKTNGGTTLNRNWGSAIDQNAVNFKRLDGNEKFMTLQANQPIKISHNHQSEFSFDQNTRNPVATTTNQPRPSSRIIRLSETRRTEEKR